MAEINNIDSNHLLWYMNSGKTDLESESTEDVPIIDFYASDSVDENTDCGELEEEMLAIAADYSSGSEYDYDINEKIEDYKQGTTGDCWLLSTLNSLSYTEKGQAIIDEAITDNEDGTYNVAFKGVDTTVTVSSEELDEAGESGTYSTGDDDVLLMETAFEKIMDMIKNGEIEDAPDWLVSASNDDITSITSGNMRHAIYLLTGDEIEFQYNCNNAEGIAAKVQSTLPFLATLAHNSLDYVYNLIEENPENYCSTITFIGDGIGENEYITVKDVNGCDVVLCGSSGHQWSIKSVNDDTVTMVNPWDSSVEVTVEKSEIEKYTSGIEYYKYS